MRSLPAVLLLLLATATVACRSERQPAAENLLLITLDTLRADHLGIYGYPRPTSPNLDAFAVDAAVFDDVTCSMPTTLPSHLSIFTGLRPLEHGVRRNGQLAARDLVTLFDLLQQQGAATAAVIASRVVGSKYLDGAGFDEVLFPGAKQQYQTRAELVTEHASAWLEQHHQTPFGLWVHYYDSHEPYAPAASFARAFDRGYRGELGDVLDVKTLVGLNQRPPDEPLTPDDLAHITDLYDAEIAYLDHHLGRLLARIDELGRLEDTVVVIVGDHGQALGDNNFFGHGLRLLEPVVKVPLLVRQPGAEPGIRVHTPVETIDLMPTVAELLSLEVPGGLAGRSLVPLLAGETLASRRFRWIERRTYPDQPEVIGLALHGGSWKAVYYRDEDGREQRLFSHRPEGLDSAGDLDAESEEARWLEAARSALLAANNSTTTAAGADDSKMLRALGYLN